MFRDVLLLFLLAPLVSLSHPIRGSSSCALDFQEALNKTLSIQQQCDSITYRDCCDVKRVTDLMPTRPYLRSGVYDIVDPCEKLRGGFTVTRGYSQACCDMHSDNGGWLVIQRRVEGGTVDFYRDWSDYEEGFGDLEGEFWYGLKNIHCLTNSASVELRVDQGDESGNKITWTYQEFCVEGPENKYQLHIGGGEGTPNTLDVMIYHNNMYFSTKDRDNDLSNNSHCAEKSKGGWWYNNCQNTNPNGLHDSSVRFISRINSLTTGIWVYYPNYEMKIRPKSCALTEASDTCA